MHKYYLCNKDIKNKDYVELVLANPNIYIITTYKNNITLKYGVLKKIKNSLFLKHIKSFIFKQNKFYFKHFIKIFFFFNIFKRMWREFYEICKLFKQFCIYISPNKLILNRIRLNFCLTQIYTQKQIFFFKHYFLVIQAFTLFF